MRNLYTMLKLKKFISIVPFILSFSLFSISGYAEIAPKNLQNDPQKTSQIIPEKSEKEVVQININTATLEDFVKNVKGIGVNKAKKIIEYRQKFGNFVSIEQLKEVSGIGQAILDKNLGIFTL